MTDVCKCCERKPPMLGRLVCKACDTRCDFFITNGKRLFVHQGPGDLGRNPPSRYDRVDR